MINFWYRLIDGILPAGSLFFLSWLLLGNTISSVEFWFGVSASGLFLFVIQLLGGYVKYAKRTIARKLEVVFKGWIFTLFILFFSAYLIGIADTISQVLFVVWAFLTPVIIFALKIIVNRFCLSRVDISAKYILVGSAYEFNDLESDMLKRKKLDVFNISHEAFTELHSVVEQQSVRGFILNVQEPASNELVRFLTRMELQGVKLYSMNHFFEHFLRKSYIPYDVIGVDYLDSVGRLSKSQYVLKRFMDVFVSGLLLLVSLPVMVFSIWKIKQQSPGNLFFKQSRVGQDTNCFEVVKFRSMHENSHFDPYTQKEDPRIYPYGQFMRKSRIDELPQLWNIFRGDMHLCGPRTEWDILVENYEKEIPFYHERHLVKPGVTGWAQVMYPYGANKEDARQKLMYDLYYIKHWSIWLEIEVLIRTVLVVLGKKGI